MINRWNDADARDYIFAHDRQIDKDILLQSYATTLLGAHSDLTMHGGGNTSVKINIIDEQGKSKRALYVKATGTPLNTFKPDYFVAMDLDFMLELKSRGRLDTEAMQREFKKCQLFGSDRAPSIESLMHSFISAKFVNHTHPAAILKIVNRIGGRELLKECFGNNAAVIPYSRMGYDLAAAVSEAAMRSMGCIGVVMQHHGLITWGDSAYEAYRRMICLVTEAEEFLGKMPVTPIAPPTQKIPANQSAQNYGIIAPIIKECFSCVLRDITGNDFPVDNISLTLLNTPDVMELVNSPNGQSIITAPPMTPDYPMFARILPLWTDVDIGGSPEAMLASIMESVGRHVSDYRDSLASHNAAAVSPADYLPHAIVHPKIGAICFSPSAKVSPQIIADFTRQAFSIRRAIAESGGVYESLPAEYLFEMQYRSYQHNLNCNI